MPIMTAMPVMHEHKHEGASEERQPDERSQDMSSMLREHEHAGNDGEPQKNESRARRKEASVRSFAFTMRMILD